MENNQVQALSAPVTALERELSDICTELASLTANHAEIPLDDSGAAAAQPTTITHASSPDAKVDLFASYFIGRTDVYAKRWTSATTGKKGWSPTTVSGIYRKDTPQNDLAPFTPDVISRHLRRASPTSKQFHAGLHPLLADDTYHLLACDFDNEEWRQDALAYATAARDHGLDPLAEISSSGEGAHIWVFFTEPISASLARDIGLRLLQEAMDTRPAMPFTSFDRFFPAQDKLPVKARGRASFGNLIALPLEGDCRDRGTTVFADPFAEPEPWSPFPDQFAALASTAKATRDDIEQVRTQLVRFATSPVTTQADDSMTHIGPKPPKSELRVLARSNEGTTAGSPTISRFTSCATTSMPRP